MTTQTPRRRPPGYTTPASRVRRAEEGWQSAADTIGPLKPETAIFVITRGQISMIDVVREVVRQLSATGPTDASIWTWCIADYEVEAFEWFLQTGQLETARLVIDRRGELRNVDLVDRWRLRFGVDQVRTCMNHAKIATVATAALRVSIRGSMNLNYNPRFEQFDLSVNDAAFDLIRRVESELPVLPRLATRPELEAATQIRHAFSADQLQTFHGIKPWTK